MRKILTHNKCSMYVKQYKGGENPILSRNMLHVFKKREMECKSYFLTKTSWRVTEIDKDNVTINIHCIRYITLVSYKIWTWLWSVFGPRISACNTLTMSYRPMLDKAFSSTPRDVFRLLWAQVCSIVWQQCTLSPYDSNCSIFSGKYPKI